MYENLYKYIEMYEKHTGDEFRFKQGFRFCFNPEYGFCEYLPSNDTLYIWQMCGDLKHWVNIALDICHKFGLKYISSFIIRKPKPFIRRLGFKIEKTNEIDGQFQYICCNHKGEKLRCTQYGDRFIFTWEVKINNV